MKSKLLIVVSIYTILMVGCESNQKVTDDLDSLVQQTLVRLQDNFLDVKTHVNIRDAEFLTLWTLQSIVADEIAYLNSLTKHIEDVADSTGQDISECTRERIKKLDAYLYPIDYTLCDRFHEDFDIRNSLRTIVKLMQEARGTIKDCGNSENCVIDKLNSIEQRSEKTHDQVFDSISKSISATSECLKGLSDEKIAALRDIEENFKLCTNIRS